MKRRRVVVTGLGLVSSLGLGVAANWEALLAGKSGIRRITRINSDGIPSQIAGECPEPPLSHLPAGEPLSFVGRMAAAAIEEALADARIRPREAGSERLGLSFATGSGQLGEDLYGPGLLNALNGGNRSYSRLFETWKKDLDPAISRRTEAGFQAGSLARLFHVTGPVLSPLTACSAGAQAIGEAIGQIERGRAERMIAGGADSRLTALSMIGYCLLGALCTDSNETPASASRPFDVTRSGFVVGEGAGALILESLEAARARKASIYAELIGFGSSSDAFRVTDPHPEGRGAVQSMRTALEDAGLAPSRVAFISAHGTSTPANDRVEGLAVIQVFGDQGRRIPVTSLKSMIGHTTAAAGAIECIGTILSVRDGKIPPTINTSRIDPLIELNVVTREAQSAELEIGLSNSFGFGGQNATLIVRRWRDETG